MVISRRPPRSSGLTSTGSPPLHTYARADKGLLQVWIKHHADGMRTRAGSMSASAHASWPRWPHWRPPAAACAGRTVEDAQAALDAMRVKDDGSVKVATVNTYAGTVKSFLGFAHQVGFTRFNAAPLIKLNKVPRQVAHRIMGELEVRMLIRPANPGRDRLMLEVAYFAGVRVSELVSLTWAQVIRRDG
jgi:integrase/recombinase XerD